MVDNCCKEVSGFLRKESREIHVVVMPDFFIDRLISLNWNVRELSGNLERVLTRKGGSIDGINQTELRGGNAINVASALSALDVKVTPIVCTSKLGLQMIRLYTGTSRIDLSHIKIFSRISMTTAIELQAEGDKANVMLRDVGSLADFGPQHLNYKDFDAIENADYICVFNWAGTKHFGTELAKTVLHDAKTEGRGKTYCDTADPTPNKEKIPELMKKVLQSGALDILSTNENEAICYGTHLSKDAGKTTGKLEEQARRSARALASHLTARVDLHTTSFSATFSKKGDTIIPAFEVPVLRATGAGDAWNAGNILGDAYGLTDACRLTLANAVAAYYVSSPIGTHPTRRQLTRFFEKLRTKVQ